MTGAFLHGLLLGLALILPLAPQNAFVLTQGATQPRWRLLLPVVVTSALSDTALITVAVAGVALVVLAIPALRLMLSVAGVLFLGYMGVAIWTSPTRDAPGALPGDGRLSRNVRRSLAVSLLNPHAIMDTVVEIGGGAAMYASALDRWSYALGSILVSWLWFVALSLVGRFMRQLANSADARRRLNRITALVMWAVALRYALVLTRSAISHIA